MTVGFVGNWALLAESKGLMDMKEVVQVLQSYLMRSLSFGECRDWLASIDWDDPALTKDDWETLGELELILTEIGEGLREVAEFWEAAVRVVAANTDVVYGAASIGEISVTVGTTTVASRPMTTTVIIDSPVSQSWNISLQAELSS